MISGKKLPIISNEDRKNILAECSFNYRFINNYGTGALKYDPVRVTNINNQSDCQSIMKKRTGNEISFKFHYIRYPINFESERKILVVPSIGCPVKLYDTEFVARLMWATEAKNRPTFMLVHISEKSIYLDNVRPILDKLGIGMVIWECVDEISNQSLLGFGATRLAAQNFAKSLLDAGFQTRDSIILMDVNVIASDLNSSPTKTVESAYDTDDGYDPKTKNFLIQKKYQDNEYFLAGAGLGSGVTKSSYEDKKLAKGGKSRPIEQVVVVKNNLFYDHQFIMSSEDADLTQNFIHQTKKLKGSKNISISDLSHFKGKEQIQKIDLGEHTSNEYVKLRQNYIKDNLAEEIKYSVIYRQGQKEQLLTIGELAEKILFTIEVFKKYHNEVLESNPNMEKVEEYLAVKPRKFSDDVADSIKENDFLRLSAIIIEKIILTYKENTTYKIHDVKEIPRKKNVKNRNEREKFSASPEHKLHDRDNSGLTPKVSNQISSPFYDNLVEKRSPSSFAKAEDRSNLTKDNKATTVRSGSALLFHPYKRENTNNAAIKLKPRYYDDKSPGKE